MKTLALSYYVRRALDKGGTAQVPNEMPLEEVLEKWAQWNGIDYGYVRQIREILDTAEGEGKSLGRIVDTKA